MIAMNKMMDQDCRQLLTAFCTKFPNTGLQVITDHILKILLAHQIPMFGKPGGWAGGIVYAVTNQGRRACGVPGLLNQECEEFFHVSMGTIYRRAAKITKLLAIWFPAI